MNKIIRFFREASLSFATGFNWFCFRIDCHLFWKTIS